MFLQQRLKTIFKVQRMPPWCQSRKLDNCHPCKRGSNRGVVTMAEEGLETGDFLEAEAEGSVEVEAGEAAASIGLTTGV
ncbi:hypothetical protein GUJ93_ZPchr0009g1518 [Zizania palustris]|uniref:Uncharacterized protein n=1 Tax=Zizania palustris TaxID=103762 RepID=A0A8J5RRZ0_ZIZPA|nr:hypothetical protein GUJ93_ZPchr0009g1518 [Zizania palustris]